VNSEIFAVLLLNNSRLMYDAVLIGNNVPMLQNSVLPPVRSNPRRVCLLGTPCRRSSKLPRNVAN